MPLPRDDSGQMNIDFLFGLAIFLMAFLYVFTFIPGLFVPYQASAIDLSSVAYKTGAILVEDPGWYIYTDPVSGAVMGDEGWETQSPLQPARIGLAVDKMSPNVVSLAKVKALNGTNDYLLVREKIGLSGTMTYNYSLKLTMHDTLSDTWTEKLNITPSIIGDSVEHMERNVMVDTGEQLCLDGSDTANPLSRGVNVVLANRPEENTDNVTVRLYNVGASGTRINLSWQDRPETLDPSDPDPTTTTMIDGQDYVVRLNGVVVPAANVLFEPGDTIEIDVFYSMIDYITEVSPLYSIWMNADTNIFPASQVDYYDDPVYIRKHVCNPGVLEVEVWADVGI